MDHTQYTTNGAEPVSYTHLDVYKRQGAATAIEREYNRIFGHSIPLKKRRPVRSLHAKRGFVHAHAHRFNRTIVSFSQYNTFFRKKQGHERPSQDIFLHKNPGRNFTTGMLLKASISVYLHNSSARASIWAREASFRAHFTVTVVSV